MEIQNVKSKSPTTTTKVAVVTGSSSGIGKETALTLARNGFLTYATMRNRTKGEDIKLLADKEKLPLKVVTLDVTDGISIKNAIQSITDEVSRIDVLVNNAGYALFGAFEDLTMEEIKAQYETNLFGVIRMTQTVLPIMRKQKSGIIVNISSAVGRFGFPITSAYASTKFAIEGLSESMAYEVEPFGIKVVLIEPGYIKTNAFNNMVTAKKSQDTNSPYSHLMENMVSNTEHGFETASPPDVVANAVLKAVTSDNPSMRYLAGKDVEKWMEAKRSVSDEEFHKMMKQDMMK
jgi:NAD(P)-dependent dehydrogenase (short-subunit alcohol dehydrogenase family)